MTLWAARTQSPTFRLSSGQDILGGFLHAPLGKRLKSPSKRFLYGFLFSNYLRSACIASAGRPIFYHLRPSHYTPLDIPEVGAFTTPHVSVSTGFSVLHALHHTPRSTLLRYCRYYIYPTPHPCQTTSPATLYIPLLCSHRCSTLLDAAIYSGLSFLVSP
jgi:hypothetical protein